MLNQLFMQFKREYWEHKTFFLWVPTVCSGIAICAILTGIVYFATIPNKQIYVEQNGSLRVYIPDRDLSPPAILFDTTDNQMISNLSSKPFEFSQRTINKQPTMHDKMPTPRSKASALAPVLIGFSTFIFTIVWIVLAWSLSSDRKDKSILVWRSLPVPEYRSVLTKYLSACLVLPIIYSSVFLLTLAAMLGMIILTEIIFSPAETLLFSPMLINALFDLFTGISAIFLIILWAMPFLGWIGLASAYPSRYSVVISTTPLFALFLFEWFIFRTSHIWTAIKDYVVEGPVNLVNLVFGVPHFIDVQQPIWGGVLAIGFITATIYMRKWRID